MAGKRKKKKDDGWRGRFVPGAGETWGGLVLGQSDFDKLRAIRHEAKTGNESGAVSLALAAAEIASPLADADARPIPKEENRAVDVFLRPADVARIKRLKATYGFATAREAITHALRVAYAGMFAGNNSSSC